MTISFIDAVFLIIIVSLAIIASFKGLIHELFTKAAFFLGLLFASMFYNKLSVYVDQVIKIHVLSCIIAFILIFILVYLIVRIIQQCVKNILQNEIMKGLDKALGFFFGVFEGFIIISFILIILYAQPWFDTTPLLGNSFFHKILSNILSTPATSVRSMVIV